MIILSELDWKEHQALKALAEEAYKAAPKKSQFLEELSRIPKVLLASMGGGSTTFVDVTGKVSKADRP